MLGITQQPGKSVADSVAAALEWPIMAVDTVSFWLKPSSFFDQNPSLDAAPTPRAVGDARHT